MVANTQDAFIFQTACSGLEYFYWNTDWSFSYVAYSTAFYFKYFVVNLIDSFYILMNIISTNFFDSEFNDTFIYSVLYDLFFYSNTFDFSNNTNFNMLTVFGWYSPFLLEHLELAAYLDRFIFTEYMPYNTSVFPSYLNDSVITIIDTSIVYGVNFVVVFYFFFIIKLFFFSFFFSMSKNTNSIDLDYAVTNAIVESEKEISAIDDLIIIIVTLLFIFGLYFGMYGLIQTLTFVNNFCLIFFIVPLFFFFIYVAPLCLLFDFGVYCFVYLRGTGPTALLAAELMYDLINLFAYYIRVCIQLARILLMLIAGGSLQEFIYYFGSYHRFLFFGESFLDDLYNIEFNSKELTYFFFVKLPLYIFYWIYEIFHTYFVVTVQTIAFFAMLFWLFFYLFTFFFSETHEEYFKKKRKLYALFFKI